MIWYEQYDIVQMDLTRGSRVNNRAGIILDIVSNRNEKGKKISSDIVFRVWIPADGMYFLIVDDIKHADANSRKGFFWDIQHDPKPDKVVVKTLLKIHEQVMHNQTKKARIKHEKEYNYDRYQKDLRSARDEYDRRTINLYNWRWMGKSLDFWFSFDRALSFAKNIFKNEEWTKALNKYLKDMDEVESAVRRWT